jgi:formylglycine-generating enzyme required for sulfatase activity/predicted Ser/Thr protein kinase
MSHGGRALQGTEHGMSNEKPSQPSEPASDPASDPTEPLRPAYPAGTVDSTEPFEAADPTELPTTDIDSEPDLEADQLLRAVAYSPPRQPRVAMAPGTRWGDGGRYTIERRLGRGGMGTVYGATDTVLQRVVALKVLDAVEHAQQATHYTRLLREAQLAARVEHERIARVYDVGTHGGFAFVAMEYVPGGTLRQWITGREVPWPQVVDIATQIAEGLAELHSHGIVHRDLKPENVMLTAQGGIKLLDFGLARHTVVALDEPPGAPVHPDAADGTTVATCGTPGYMAPEQYGNQPLDARIDVFALGVIIYELATGQRLFRGTTPREIMNATLAGAPPMTGGAWASAPERLRGCAGQMLAVDPRQRFADGIKALGALRELAPTLPPPRSGLPAATLTGRDLTQPDLRPGGAGRPLWSVRFAGRASVVAAVAALIGLQAVKWWHRPTQLPTPPGMVRIDVGAIDVGRNADEIDRECKDIGSGCDRAQMQRESPRTRVTVPPFFLDDHEVTNEEFARLLSNYSAVFPVEEDHDDHYPRYVHRAHTDGSDIIYDLHAEHAGIVYEKRDYRARPGYEKLPAVQMSWVGAKLYCETAGKRLPTEDEWEAAARGHDDRRFPWGSELPRCGDVVIASDGKVPMQGTCPPGDAAKRPVGFSHQDVTPDGIHDLGGSVAEWTSSPYIEGSRHAGPEVSRDTQRVIRGGSWAASLMVRTSGRSRRPPETTGTNLGFRCASSARDARP